jgi:hypothetical protein
MEKKKIPSKTRIIIALVCGCICLIGGFIVSFNDRSGDTTEEIRHVEDAIDIECADIGKVEHDSNIDANLVLLAPSWDKIGTITRPLIYTNEKIAKAKALLRCQANPIPSGSLENYLWENRFDISKQDWKIQSIGSRILGSTFVATIAFFVSIIVTYLTLTIGTWLWYFLLNRISELSQAIRGK